MAETTGIRINKYLSEQGFCSRRAADKLIEQERVSINGKVPEMGTRWLLMVNLFLQKKKSQFILLLTSPWVLFALQTLELKKIIS